MSDVERGHRIWTGETWTTVIDFSDAPEDQPGILHVRHRTDSGLTFTTPFRAGRRVCRSIDI
ncbi:hypothetical protein [Thermomonospora umbrina]|nr:hypothetical protein [Thermomonospora umbrina]